MYDVVIIGAGMSGLAAGARLAHYDQKVLVLERHYAVGGLNSYYRLRGRFYDVGLHAVTNFTRPGCRTGPLARLLRQLRLRWEDLALCEQLGSAVAFPGVTLNFTNDFELFRAEVQRAFPAEKDNFERLLARLPTFDEAGAAPLEVSAREVLAETIGDELLREMLLCPLAWYGSAREDDMDLGLFAILFRSIFLEGLARPFSGVRQILKQLVRKFKADGGELRTKAGINKSGLKRAGPPPCCSTTARRSPPGGLFPRPGQWKLTACSATRPWRRPRWRACSPLPRQSPCSTASRHH